MPDWVTNDTSIFQIRPAWENWLLLLVVQGQGARARFPAMTYQPKLQNWAALFHKYERSKPIDRNEKDGNWYIYPQFLIHENAINARKSHRKVVKASNQVYMQNADTLTVLNITKLDGSLCVY